MIMPAATRVTANISAASPIEPGRAENIGRVFGAERADFSGWRIPGLPELLGSSGGSG